MPSAVLALPCGSRSMTSTVLPAWARAAATLTVVVVLPTPPFWFATVSTRVRGGRGTARPLSVMRLRASSATARASGVCSSAPGIAAAIWARCSVSSCRVGLASMPSSRAWVLPVSLSTRPPTATSSLRVARRRRPRRRGRLGVTHPTAVVSRETVSGPGQPSGVVAGPASRGNPSPGAAVRSSATSIVVLTRAHLLARVQGVPITTSRTPDTPKRHPHIRAQTLPTRLQRPHAASPVSRETPRSTCRVHAKDCLLHGPCVDARETLRRRRTRRRRDRRQARVMLCHVRHPRSSVRPSTPTPTSDDGCRETAEPPAMFHVKRATREVAACRNAGCRLPVKPTTGARSPSRTDAPGLTGRLDGLTGRRPRDARCGAGLRQPRPQCQAPRRVAARAMRPGCSALDDRRDAAFPTRPPELATFASGDAQTGQAWRRRPMDRGWWSALFPEAPQRRCRAKRPARAVKRPARSPRRRAVARGPPGGSAATADRRRRRLTHAAGPEGCSAVGRRRLPGPWPTPARRALRLEPQVDGEHRLVEHVAAVLGHHGRHQARAAPAPRRSSSSSVAADLPFMATRVPPGSSSGHAPAGQLVEPGHRAGRHPRGRHRARELLGAPAVHASRCRARGRRRRRTASRYAAASARRGARRGRAAPPPGRPPAARPRSRRRRPGPRRGKASATTAQLSTCRSHSRGTSRGPMSPCVTPVSARISANRTASGIRSPNTAAAPEGAAGSATGCSSVSSCFT